MGLPPSIRGSATGRTRPLFTATWSSATRCSAFKRDSIAPGRQELQSLVHGSEVLEYQQHATAGRRNADYAGLGRTAGLEAARPMKYERDYADDLLVTHALTDRYYGLKRYDDAEPLQAKRFVALEPGYMSLRVLANVYQSQKTIVAGGRRWTRRSSCRPLDSSKPWFRTRSPSTCSSTARNGRKRPPTRDAAAQSGSSWSDDDGGTLPRNAEGEWDKAEELVTAVSKHYDDHVTANWMCWCHRTGRGNVRAADELVHAQMGGWREQPLVAEQSRRIGFYCLVLGQLRTGAVGCFQNAQRAKSEFYSAFHAAIVADLLGKTSERDQLLEEILKMPPQNAQYDEGRGTNSLPSNCKLYAAPRNARLNVAVVDKILALLPSTIQVIRAALLCRGFPQNRGDTWKNAKKYLIRCAQAMDWEGIEHMRACQLLREMKVEIPPAAVPADDDPPKTPRRQRLPR